MLAIASSRKRKRSLAFISTWKTDNISEGSSSATQISLPLYAEGIYDFTVDWGDGTASHITDYNLEDITHTYTLSGIYTLTITGTLFGFRFADVGDTLKLLSVQQWGCLRIGNLGWTFMGCRNLNIPDVTDIINLKGVTDLTYMFCYCNAITAVNNINDWDMGRIVKITGVFYETNFNQPLNNWDTSNVTNMVHLFAQNAVFNQPLDTWDTEKVTTMRLMFWGASAFNQNIDNWNTGSVTDMYQMFCSATSFNQPLNSWDTGNVENMQGLFRSASSFNKPLNNWNTSKVI